MTILVITGMRRECRLLAGPGVEIVAGGGDPGRLYAEAARLALSANGILSMGIAGGLAPKLRPGEWVVADAIVDGDATCVTDAAWSSRLAARLPGATRGRILGRDAMAATAGEKAELHRASGALAVDMESHIAARIAAQRSLPLAVARVLSDGAKRTLPSAARVALSRDGSIDLPAVLRSLLTAPWQLPALVRTGLEAERGFRALARGRRRIGPDLGFVGADIGQLPVDVT